MSATLLTVFSTSHVSGLDYTANAVAADGANGNTFPNSGAQSLVVINGGGSPCVVTKVYGPGAVFDGTTPSSPTVSVPAGHTMEIGPMPPALYNDANGRANFTFNQVTSVTVLAKQLGT
jgi:hypothetical protein